MAKLYNNGKPKSNIRTQVIVVKKSSHKYSISAMRKFLEINRSSYYYEAAQNQMSRNLNLKLKQSFIIIKMPMVVEKLKSTYDSSNYMTPF